MAETLKDVIEQLKIQNTSSKLPVVGEIKNLGTQFSKLNFNFKRFTDSSVQLNSEMMEKNELINAENLSNQNDNAELLNLQLMDIGNVFSTKIDDLKSLLVEGPRVSDEMLDEVKNQSNYMQELGMMQGDYFTELKQQLITNDAPTREEIKEDDSDDKVAKDTLIISKDSNSILNQMMSFFMAESERDKLREQEEKNERKSTKPLSEKTVDPSRLIRGNKGILGILQEFLTTAFLGSKGKALLRTLIPGKFTLGGFGKTLLTGIAGVLFGPELLSVISTAITDGMKAEDMTSGVIEGAKSFLKNADGTTLAALGGVAGVVTGGIPGAIAGALIGMAVKGIGDLMGGEATVVDLAMGDVTPLQGLIGGAASGAAIGFGLGGPGLVGKIGAALIGAGIGGLAGVLNSKDTNLNVVSIMTSVLGGLGGLMVGMKAGALLGAVGGPVGMIAGALLGAALGLALGSIMTEPSEAKKKFDEVAKTGSDIVSLENKVSEGTATEEDIQKLDVLKTQAQTQVTEFKDKTGPVEGQSGRMVMAYSESFEEAAGAARLLGEEELNQFKKRLNERLGTNINQLGDYIEYSISDGIFTFKKDLETSTPEKGKFTIKAGTEFDTALGQAGVDFTRFKSLEGILFPWYRTGKFAEQHSMDEGEKNKEYNEQGFWKKLTGDLSYEQLDEQKYFNEFLKSISFAQGGLIGKDAIVRIGEDARFNPEGVFNRPQMQYIADLIKPKETMVRFKTDNDFVKNPQIQEKYLAMNSMQTENEARRREMATPIVMPPSAPNIVDNKNITVQEQFNVTEMLPAPSSHVSFKDNIVY